MSIQHYPGIFRIYHDFFIPLYQCFNKKQMLTISQFYYILTIFSVMGLFVFITLFFIKAGYGMFRTAKWGISVSNKAGWILMESPVFFVMLWLWIKSDLNYGSVPFLFFLIFELHYFQRSFIFPILMKGKSMMPVAILIMGIVFNLLNGYIQGAWLFYLAPKDIYTVSYLHTASFIAGIIIFFLGLSINWHSDYIIRHLRKPGDTRHYLPKKGMYKWVTCGNYFGELLEWTGFAIMTSSPAAWVFVWWTFANLAPRAYKIRQKYREEFGITAVGKRKCLIPYIF